MFALVKNPYNDESIHVSVLSNGTIKHYTTTWKKFYRAVPPENVIELLHNKQYFFKMCMDAYEWEYYALKYYDYFYIMDTSITDKEGNVYTFREK